MKRTLTALALLPALALPVQALDLNALSPDEEAAFGVAVREYLLANPEVIMEAVAILESRQAEAQARNETAMVEAHAAQLYDSPNAWVGGNPDGDITLVEFIDYRCGFCRRAHAEVEELVASDGNIRFIVKELPILGDNSTASSRFAIATRLVAGDDAYKAAHDALIKVNGDMTEPALRRLANSLDLDADAILAQMNSDDVNRVLAETRALAQSLNINGTPTFVLGGQLLRGYVPLAGMQQVVADVRDAG